MRQRILAMSTRRRNDSFLVERRKPILGGSGLTLGPLDQQRLFGSFCGAPDGRGAHAHAGEARAQRIGRASRHVIVRQACFGRLSANSLTLMRGPLAS